MKDQQQIDAVSCQQSPGTFTPVIDRNKCEGKADCVSVCPQDVFVIGILPKSKRGDLTLMGKVKGLAHGWKQAFMPNIGACEACGFRVSTCPEKAISLTRNLSIESKSSAAICESILFRVTERSFRRPALF
jgi:4Fe-4S ferredoxin